MLRLVLHVDLEASRRYLRVALVGASVVGQRGLHPSVITAAASSGAEHGDDENEEQWEAHPTDDPHDFRSKASRESFAALRVSYPRSGSAGLGEGTNGPLRNAERGGALVPAGMLPGTIEKAVSGSLGSSRMSPGSAHGHGNRPEQQRGAIKR